MKSRSKALLTLMSFVLLMWGCDYERMKEQESVRTYETRMPEMPPGTIPVDGGLAVLKEMDPQELENPLSPDPAAVERGRVAYGHYCVFCHGPKGNGHSTVGQSFYPLPTDLTDPYVQGQTDGELFYSMSVGINRMPPLADTVAEEDRWAIIHFLRFLAKELQQ